jgi:hypothetical protein
LFLDRERAAKTVGPPVAAPGSVAALGPRADAVQRVFDPLGVKVRAAAHEGDAVLLTEPMRRAGRSAVAWLKDGAASLIDFDVPVGVWVSDLGPYGRVVEISTRKNAAVRPALAFDLVGWLRAVPLLTYETSLLQALDHASKHCNGLAAEDRHLGLALAAARVWSTGAVADTGIADSAAIIAGFMPAYTGGPFTYLHHQGHERVTSRTNDLGGSQGSLFFAVEGWNELFGCRRTLADR